jgi:hypothetical protein
MRFVVVGKFIRRVIGYFGEIKRMRTLVSNAASAVAEAAAEAVNRTECTLLLFVHD